MAREAEECGHRPCVTAGNHVTASPAGGHWETSRARHHRRIFGSVAAYVSAASEHSALSPGRVRRAAGSATGRSGGGLPARTPVTALSLGARGQGGGQVADSATADRSPPHCRPLAARFSPARRPSSAPMVRTASSSSLADGTPSGSTSHWAAMPARARRWGPPRTPARRRQRQPLPADRGHDRRRAARHPGRRGVARPLGRLRL